MSQLNSVFCMPCDAGKSSEVASTACSECPAGTKSSTASPTCTVSRLTSHQTNFPFTSPPHCHLTYLNPHLHRTAPPASTRARKPRPRASRARQGPTRARTGRPHATKPRTAPTPRPRAWKRRCRAQQARTARLAAPLAQTVHPGRGALPGPRRALFAASASTL